MENVLTALYSSALLYHAYTDWRTLLLYDSVNLFLLLLGIIRCCWRGSVMASLAGAAVLGAVMLLLYAASRGGMGEGDVKLACVLGLWLGTERGLLCLLLAFVSGAVAGVLLALSGKLQRNTLLPFGPFLAGSWMLAEFWGAELLTFYWGIIYF